MAAVTAAAAGLVTALYRLRLAEALTRQAALVSRLWNGFNAEDPEDGSPEDRLAAIADAMAPLVAAGQAVFMAEALAYLRGLTAEAAGTSLAATAPYAAPAGVTGFTHSGAPVGSLLGIAPRVYRERIAQGWEPPEAAASARALLDAVAVSEPYRAANETVVRNAAEDERLTGRVNRVPEPDACQWCVTIADRGYVIATAGFAAHAHCRCTASPEISGHVTSRRQIEYARRMRAGEPTVPPPRLSPDEMAALRNRFRTPGIG